MIVKPVIFDNILFGELSPWHSDNTSETRFRDILNNQVRINKDDPQRYFKNLIASLKDYSININLDHLPSPERLADLAKFADLQSLFDNLEILPHFNKASEFYRFLIANETTRILCAIANNVKKSKAQIDAAYQVTTLLANLEFSREQVSQKSCSDKVCTYVVDSLKIALFRIYEEIKAMYPSLLTAEVLSESELIYQLAPKFEKEKTIPTKLSFRIQKYLEAKVANPTTNIVSSQRFLHPGKLPTTRLHTLIYLYNLNTSMISLIA